MAQKVKVSKLNQALTTVSNTKYGKRFLDWATEEETRALMLFDNDNVNPKFPTVLLFSKFGMENSQGIQIQSNITNNYTEANIAINDHWAIQPLTFTLSGVIGELKYTPTVRFLEKSVKSVTKYVDGLTAISPTLDSYTRAIENVAKAIDDSIEQYRQVARSALLDVNYFQSAIQTTNTRYAYERIMAVINNRQLVNIKTVWGDLNNMAITSFSVTQSDNRYKTDVEIKLQQWRDVLTITRPATAQEKSEFAQNQLSATTEHGVASTQNDDLRRTIARQRADNGKSPYFWIPGSSGPSGNIGG